MLVFELGPHLYRSVIVLSVWVWVFELGLHLCWSVIFRVSSSFWGCTYIDRSFFVLVWVFGAAPISIGHVPITFMFNLIRGHTYIDRPSSYHLVCLSLSQDRTYINRSSSCQFEFNLSRDRTYIDRPCSYHFSCSVWVGTAPISIGHSSCQF